MALISTEETKAYQKRHFSSILTLISQSKYKNNGETYAMAYDWFMFGIQWTNEKWCMPTFPQICLLGYRILNSLTWLYSWLTLRCLSLVKMVTKHSFDITTQTTNTNKTILWRYDFIQCRWWCLISTIKVWLHLLNVRRSDFRHQWQNDMSWHFEC